MKYSIRSAAAVLLSILIVLSSLTAIFSYFCTVSGDQRTITIQVMNLPFATDPSCSNTLKLNFECDKYLYGYCTSAKVCPLFEKA